MKGLLAVAYMEARDRAGLLLLGLVVGLGLLLVQVLGPLDADVGESGQAALLLAAVTLVVASLFLGLSLPSHDQATRRLIHYHSRPLETSQIWGGRLLGLSLLLALSTALVMLPVALFGAIPEMPDTPSFPRLSLGAGWRAATVIAAASFLFGHSLSAGLQRGAAWALLHFAVVAAGFVALVDAASRLIADAASPELLAALPATGAALLLSGAAAGHVHLSLGRGDPRRGAVPQSLVLWAGLAVAVVGLQLRAHAVIERGPEEIRPRLVVANTDASAFFVVGSAIERPSTWTAMLIDPRSGAHAELARNHAPATLGSSSPPGARHCNVDAVAVATDGPDFAWSCSLSTRALGVRLLGASVRGRRPLLAPGVLPGSAFLPFAGGTRLALLRHESRRVVTVEVFDVATGELSWSRQLGTIGRADLLAADESGLLVANRPSERGFELMRLSGGSSPSVIDRSPSFAPQRFELDPEGNALLAVEESGSARLIALDEGGLLRSVAATRARQGPWLLTGRRLLVLEPTPPLRLTLRGSDGDRGPSFRLDPKVRRVQVVGECAPERVVVLLQGPDGETGLLLDLETASSTPLPTGLSPLQGHAHPRLRFVPQPDTPAARWLLLDGGLVELDFERTPPSVSTPEWLE